MNFPKKIGDWSKHPWNKISHILIAIVIILTGYFIGWAWEAAMLYFGISYGRGQVQDERMSRDYVTSWMPWTWSRDGMIDWAVPSVVAILVTWLLTM